MADTEDHDKALVLKLLKEKPRGIRGTLIHIAKSIIRKRKILAQYAKAYGSPFYLIDEEHLHSDVQNFKKSFDTHLPNHQAFYAVKANYHPFILQKMVAEGLGLDVSSERELELAIEAGAKKILFSGPGKSEADLRLAIQHGGILTINLDSFEELHRLGKITNQTKTTIRAGIRFFTTIHGTWSKFGIPLSQLKKFWTEAKKYPFIHLEGVQFHTSLNLTSEKYCKILEELAAYLKKNFSQKQREEIKFIDIGGGYYPDNVEGFYPWSDHYPWTLSGGHITKLAHEYYGEKVKFKDKYFVTRAESQEVMAKKIGTTIDNHLKNLINCAYYTEPGRILVNNSSSIMGKIMDVKDNVVILDAGINATGWEFGQHFYMPIINITHPDTKEKNMEIYGSLCTPRDLWGHSIYAKKVQPGNTIVIPNQGAYKFTLAQTFIKSIPPTYIMRSGEKEIMPYEQFERTQKSIAKKSKPSWSKAHSNSSTQYRN